MVLNILIGCCLVARFSKRKLGLFFIFFKFVARDRGLVLRQGSFVWVVTSLAI